MTLRARVQCIVESTPPSPPHIEAFDAVLEAVPSVCYRWTEAQAIADMSGAQPLMQFYTQDGAGNEAIVIVKRHSKTNRPYLTTTPDHSKQDNLLWLPRCRTPGCPSRDLSRLQQIAQSALPNTLHGRR
jgi:hypothetical protein